MLRTIGLAATGLLLLAAAANVMDPYLVPARPWTPVVILAAAAAGVMLNLRGKGRRGASWWLLLTLWCAAPVTLGVAEAVFYLRKAAVLAATGPEVRLLGRHFLVGYTDIGEVEQLAANGFIGGVFLTAHNARGKTAEALRAEIARLQAVRAASSLPPLVIATDQEGGAVSRLSPPLPQMPPLATLADLPADRRASAAYDYGVSQGRDLAAVGVTVNFGPVADLRPRGNGGVFDRNTHLELRAISPDAMVVADVTLAHARGLDAAGVTATVKHFPGLGRVTEDTHHFRTRITTTKAELEHTDWLPFRRILSSTKAIVMLGHAVLTAIDPERPASHSERVIDGVLRREWDYHGVIVTDDLVMSPIYQYGLCDAVIEGLNAGVDLLLVAYDGQQFYRAMRCAINANRDGLLDKARLDVSEQRLNTLSVRQPMP